MSKLREQAGLLIILAAFWALGVLYLRVTPLLETPDEPSHFSVVKYIADVARLPPARPAPEDASPVPVILPGPPVYYAPPLYYVLGAPLIADLDTDGFAQAVIPSPNWARGWAPAPGRVPENKHIYVHTADQRPPYAGWAAAMIRLRVFSLLLGGATVGGVYALARTLWPRARDSGWALAATSLVAFNPAFLFVTVGVTNDALLVALCTWAFVLMARLLLREGDWSRGMPAQNPAVDCGRRRSLKGWTLVVLQGVVLGLAALTKQSAVVFFPAAALALIWGARSTCREPRVAEPDGGEGSRGGQPWRTVIVWLLIWAVLIALLAGWWYLRNTLAYGDPLGFQPHQTPAGEWRPPLSLMVRQLGDALRGYWGTFGWGLILVEPLIYGFIGVWVLLGLLGLLVPSLASVWWVTGDADDSPGKLRFLSRLWTQRLVRRAVRQSSRRENAGKKYERQVLVILGLAVLLNLAGLILWLWRTSAPYGRLLFPTLGPLAVLLTLGWRCWLGRERGRAFAWTVALAMGLYAVIVPFRYLRPAYASPVASPLAAAGATPLDVQFDEKICLLGYQMKPESVGPGDAVTLTLYWQTLAPLERDLTVFVQLAPGDPQQRVAGLDEYLGSSRYPTSVWQTGDVIRQVHELRLPDRALAPAVYWFTVGLYGEPGSERLAAVADGSPVPDAAVRLGPLRVLDRETRQPQHELDYRLGSAVRLSGYDVDLLTPRLSEDSPAESITVTLYWQADAAPEGDLIVFVHLLDADGRLVAQGDGPPGQGDYPTWAWREGDRVTDPHVLTLPSDLVSGTFSVRVGLYRPDDGARMPVFDAAGERLPDDILPLAEIDLSFEGDQGGN